MIGTGILYRSRKGNALCNDSITTLLKICPHCSHGRYRGLKMCAAAVQLREIILNKDAGTIEFVDDTKDGTFYFLEV